MDNPTPFNPEQSKTNFEIKAVRRFAETIYNLPNNSEEKKLVMRFVAKYFAELENPDIISEEEALKEVLKFLKNPYLVVDNNSIANILKQNGYNTQKFNQEVKKRLRDKNVVDENNNPTPNAGDIIQGKSANVNKSQDITTTPETTGIKLPGWGMPIAIAFAIVTASGVAVKLLNKSTPTPPPPIEQQQNKIQNLNRDQNTNNAPGNTN
jgi:hypothetical protein